MIRALLLALLLALPANAQEITQGMPAGAPMFYGTAVVSYTQATLAVGKFTADVSVPGIRVGDLVLVKAETAAGISVGSVLNALADVPADGTARITWNTPGLVAVTLGTVQLRFRWMRF